MLDKKPILLLLLLGHLRPIKWVREFSKENGGKGWRGEERGERVSPKKKLFQENLLKKKKKEEEKMMSCERYGRQSVWPIVDPSSPSRSRRREVMSCERP